MHADALNNAPLVPPLMILVKVTSNPQIEDGLSILKQIGDVINFTGSGVLINELNRVVQNAVVGAASKTGRRRPNTLSEAVRRNSSPYALRGNGKEPQQTDAFSERMRRLAGIK